MQKPLAWVLIVACHLLPVGLWAGPISCLGVSFPFCKSETSLALTGLGPLG